MSVILLWLRCSYNKTKILRWTVISGTFLSINSLFSQQLVVLIKCSFGLFCLVLIGLIPYFTAKPVNELNSTLELIKCSFVFKKKKRITWFHLKKRQGDMFASQHDKPAFTVAVLGNWRAKVLQFHNEICWFLQFTKWSFACCLVAKNKK